MTINRKNASLIMVLLSILFGINYVFTKMVVVDVHPFVVLFYSNVFGLICVALVVIVKKIPLKLSMKTGLKEVLVANLLYLCVHIFSLIGINYTTSSNASFIVQTSVLIIPILNAAINRTKLSARTVLLALLALFGIAVMTIDLATFSFKIGDLIFLFVATLFSLYIIFLDKINPKINVTAVSFYYFVMGIVLHFGLAAFTVGAGNVVLPFENVDYLLAFSAYALISVFAVLIQVEVVKFIDVDKMAIFYCLEPITTIIAAFFFLNEVATPRIALGGAIVIFAIMLPFLKSKFAKGRP